MRIIKINLFVIISYLIAFWLTFNLVEPLQKHFLPADAHNGSLVFLPHGVRVIAIILFGLNALPGIFFSHLISGLLFLDLYSSSLSLVFTLSLFSTIALYLGSLLVFDKKQLYGIKINNINLKNILAVSIIASAFNSLFNIMVYYFFNVIKTFNINDNIIFFVGDIFGALLLFYMLNTIKNTFFKV